MPKIAIEKSTDKDEYGLLLNDTPLATLLPIPSGSFLRRDSCTITVDAFYMAQFPVTQELYEAVMGYNPASFEGENNPVEQVTWYDAVSFCEALNKTLGIVTGFYSMDKGRQDKNNESGYDELKWTVNFNEIGSGFRLPTESEWEYAAKGSKKAINTVEFTGSNTLEHVGWYRRNNYYETKPSGLKFPNTFGLYDMSGNVWEWCWDWYDEYGKRVLTNPTGAQTGTVHAIRGGSWFDLEASCRSEGRDYWGPDHRHYFLSFRLVFVP